MRVVFRCIDDQPTGTLLPDCHSRSGSRQDSPPTRAARFGRISIIDRSWLRGSLFSLGPWNASRGSPRPLRKVDKERNRVGDPFDGQQSPGRTDVGVDRGAERGFQPGPGPDGSTGRLRRDLPARRKQPGRRRSRGQATSWPPSAKATSPRTSPRESWSTSSAATRFRRMRTASRCFTTRLIHWSTPSF